MEKTSNLATVGALEAFLMGAGSVWCIFPMVQRPASLKVSFLGDGDSIANDWQAVGLDLLSAMNDAALLPYEASKNKLPAVTRPGGTPPLPESRPVNPTVRSQAQPQSVVAQISTTEFKHSGPLPAPATLAEYEQVMTGLAGRIVSMAELQQRSRIEKEHLAMSTDVRIALNTSNQVLIGQVLSFLLSGGAIAGAVYVALHGQSWVGAALAGGGGISLINGVVQSWRAKNPAPADPVGPIR